ncbi:MAG: prepilin-type N-terminal cleavage/methylation domain-containing protein [Kiritimatiellae bacterium]|nr:prepilin-type N-terminal cleavage/methylation domain-containing protein [Kiritimatiellia bacterium]
MSCPATDPHAGDAAQGCRLPPRKPRRGAARSGFTLVEALVAVAIAAVLAGAAAGALMLVVRLDRQASLTEDLARATRAVATARRWAGSAAWSNGQPAGVRAEYRIVRDGSGPDTVEWALWELSSVERPSTRTRLWLDGAARR